MIYAETLGEQLDDPSPPISSDGASALSSHVATFAIRFAESGMTRSIGPPVLDISPVGNVTAGTRRTRHRVGILRSRNASRRLCLKAYGGTALTEDAVDEGLRGSTARISVAMVSGAFVDAVP